MHIAYARRDIKTICLLESYGADNTIINLDGLTPIKMLNLNYKNVSKLLEFHTSPDGHPKTFFLDKNNY